MRNTPYNNYIEPAKKGVADPHHSYQLINAKVRRTESIVICYGTVLYGTDSLTGARDSRSPGPVQLLSASPTPSPKDRFPFPSQISTRRPVTTRCPNIKLVSLLHVPQPEKEDPVIMTTCAALNN